MTIVFNESQNLFYELFINNSRISSGESSPENRNFPEKSVKMKKTKMFLLKYKGAESINLGRMLPNVFFKQTKKIHFPFLISFSLSFRSINRLLSSHDNQCSDSPCSKRSNELNIRSNSNNNNNLTKKNFIPNAKYSRTKHRNI